MRVWSAIVAAGMVSLLAACGGGDDSAKGGAVTLNLWVFNEPSGSFTDAAKRCSASSDGKYKVVFNALSSNADAQRQALVRRLAAKDPSIDIMGMDVVWTAEFADAGWIKAWPQDKADQVTKGTLKGPLSTATYQDKLYAAPANTNTQLLWYRKDLVKDPASTWDGIIEQASKLKKSGLIETPGAQYEGSVVWFNSLVGSAGGTLLEGDKVTPSEAWKKAAGIMSKLAKSKAADPSLASHKEDQARLAFEQGKAVFQVNYPFIYPSAKEGNPKVFKQIGWRPYPRVDADKPSKAPIGGINWGVSSYGKYPDQAFDAAACLRNAANQRQAAIAGGLPPTLESLYDDKKFTKDYPFADLIRKSVDSGAVRPKTPAYADVSLAIAKTVSPPGSIKVDSFLDDLKKTISDALDSKALI